MQLEQVETPSQSPLATQRLHLGGSSHLEGDTRTIADADHASGALVSGSPKWTFIPKGSAVPPCVSFIKKPVQETCTTTCGYDGDTYYGDVPCVETKSEKSTTDGVCQFWQHTKPAPLSLTCPSTPACTEWVTTPASMSCTTSCDFHGSTNYGTSTCREVESGRTVTDSACVGPSQSAGSKPQVPTHYCRPTAACCPNRCCDFVMYGDSGYRGHLGTISKCSAHGSSEYFSLSKHARDRISSFQLNGWCSQVKVYDDDNRWARDDKHYSSDASSLPNDLNDDVKGVTIWPSKNSGC